MRAVTFANFGKAQTCMFELLSDPIPIHKKRTQKMSPFLVKWIERSSIRMADRQTGIKSI
ncbi:hypothetical protein BGP76_00350 [Reichenbachiella sp. MSK19-1]|nr:hypothetical protein BGP76_00350 [Reichenbachiella sp. MSK19-1]